MATASWYKVWHGAVNDPKLRLVGRRSGVGMSGALAIWMHLLDHASQAEDRGGLVGLEPAVVAAALELEEDQVQTAIQVMSDLGMIEEGRLSAWGRRQGGAIPSLDGGAEGRARQGRSGAERTRAYRERKRAGDGVTAGDAVTGDVTRNAPSQRDSNSSQVTDVTPYKEEEKEREKESSRSNVTSQVTALDGERLRRTVVEVFRLWGRHPATAHGGLVRQWLADGADPELDILPAIQEVVGRGMQPGSLAYFTPAVMHRLKDRREAEKAGDALVAAADGERQRWALRVGAWRRDGRWLESWGPPPGQPGCQAPRELVTQAA